MATFPEIGPSAALAKLDEFQVVDVRGVHEYHGPLGRVPGAMLLPLPDLAARVGELPKGRALLLVCRSGVRSGKACELISSLGIGPVVNLAGGMIGWNEARLPREETNPSSLAELVDGLVAWVAQVAAKPREAVREELRDPLEGPGIAAGVDGPTRERVERALERVETSFREKGAPPDLELSLATYRRWLSAL